MGASGLRRSELAPTVSVGTAEATMTMYSSPTVQPYAHAANVPGEPTRDIYTMNLYRLGQTGPRATDAWRAAHGRHLAGLGASMNGFAGENETQAPWDPDYRSDSMREMEKEDDVYGSGIFDTYGREPTVNPDLGLFADHPSLPGYIDREVAFAVSKDIFDITSGAQVVTVPAGGMTYQERGGLPQPFTVRGQIPRPPPRAIPPMTNMDQPYVGLAPGRQQSPPVRREGIFQPLPGPAPAPRYPAPQVPQLVQGRPIPDNRVPMFPVGREVGFQTTVNPVRVGLPSGPVQGARDTPFKRVPFPGVTERVGMQSITNAAVTSYPTSQSYRPTPLQMSQQQSTVGSRSIVDVGSPSGVIPTGMGHYQRRAMGAADEGPGWGTFAFAGLLIGASAAMFFGTVKMKGGAR